MLVVRQCIPISVLYDLLVYLSCCGIHTGVMNVNWHLEQGNTRNLSKRTVPRRVKIVD